MSDSEYGPPSGWPTFSEYGGGGVLLSPTTHPETVESCCSTPALLRQVREMFGFGFEVIVRRGAIVAAQAANIVPPKPVTTWDDEV